MTDDTTIAAIATPTGAGGVGIIRVSGPKVKAVAESLLGQCPKARYATYGPFRWQGQVLDYGIALYFKGPHSFTGEDVLELQGHGGSVVLRHILSVVLQMGVLPAEPGHFTLRAFLNNKIDLAQAEAIADLINAQSTQAATAALRSMSGDFSRSIAAMVEALRQLQMWVEAALDFPEEEIDTLHEQTIATQFQTIVDQLQEILTLAQQGALLKAGATWVIAGAPNGGKSSLLNALAAKNSAIVTEVAGTTRDILTEDITVEGVPICIKDTAGIRQTSDVVEQEGVRRSKEAISSADGVLLVLDGLHNAETKQVAAAMAAFIQEHPDLSTRPMLVVINKIDLIQQPPKIQRLGETPVVYLSAQQKQGIDLLQQQMFELMGGDQRSVESVFSARARHVDAVEKALKLLQQAQQGYHHTSALELMAEDLKQASKILETITGAYRPDDLLGKIFSEFCIGK